MCETEGGSEKMVPWFECRMPIAVICPGCRKTFHVSEKFAGKSGPCPSCKSVINVPAQGAEVKVHVPTDFGTGGRTTAGKLALKPIARKQIKLQPVAAAIIGGVSLATIVAAWLGGKIGLLNLDRWTGYLGVTVGLAIVSPVLVVAAYSFLRDDELEPYRGMSLFLRAGACAVGYMVLWGVFGYVAGSFQMKEELWSWAFVAPPFFLVGSLAAYGSLDLEFGNSFFHYSFYVLITIFLRWVAGMGWVWNIAPL